VAHEWERIIPGMADFGKGERRKCKRCGAVQELYVSYRWQRVDKRRWLPLVGRCKVNRGGKG
jgi:hypothetical protein